MSDTTLALLITVLVLLALAAWVPLLHAAHTITLRSTGTAAQTDTPATWQDEEGLEDTREIA